MKQLVRFLLIILIGGLVWLPTMKTGAASSDGLNFTVIIRRPNNTIDSKQGYFNLLVKPGEQQKLTLLVKNKSAQRQRINVQPVSAYTSSTGTVAYQTRVDTNRTIARYQFSDVVKGKKVVDLAPQQTKAVNFLLRLPARRVNGMLMGGL